MVRVDSIYFGHATTYATSLRPLIAEAPVRLQANTCRICDEKVGTLTGFFSSTLVSPVTAIPPVPHAH